MIDLSTRYAECQAEMFPLAGVFDSAMTNEWMLRYVHLDQERNDERLRRWNLFQKEILVNFIEYKITSDVTNGRHT